MTHRATGAGVGVPRIWLLPLTLTAGLVFATAVGWLSRSIVLDFIAWWPVWLLLVVVAILARGRRLWNVRLSGVVPLVVTTTLLLFTAGHMLGWPAMPSSAQSLVGPVVGSESRAALSARLEGSIELSRGADFLYEVDPIRRGGEIGIPSATEQVQGSSISVVLDPPPDPGFYAFAGWEITLSELPVWNLTLEGDIAADFTALDMSGVQAFGSGTLILDQVAMTVPATIAGTFEVLIPAGVAARIIGQASVPDSWNELSDGARSPVPGDGWVISVPDGSNVTVIEG